MAFHSEWKILNWSHEAELLWVKGWDFNLNKTMQEAAHCYGSLCWGCPRAWGSWLRFSWVFCLRESIIPITMLFFRCFLNPNLKLSFIQTPISFLQLPTGSFYLDSLEWLRTQGFRSKRWCIFPTSLSCLHLPWPGNGASSLTHSSMFAIPKDWFLYFSPSSLEIVILSEPKADRERQISYDIAYIRNLKKMVKINLFTKQKQINRFLNQIYGMWGKVINWEIGIDIYTLQFSSVAQSCLTLCNPMNHSMPGLPVHHQLLESTQTHVHWIRGAIQPFHPLSSPSPPAFNLSQHQGLFQWVSSPIRWPKYWSFSFNISPSNEHQDFSPLGWTGWISLKSKGLSRVFSNTTLKRHQFFCAQLSL